MAPRLEPWLEPLTLPAGAPFDFFHFFEFFLIFFEKPKNQKIKFFDFFLIFFEKGQKKRQKSNNPGPWVSPRGLFLAVGIPPLPDPEWLQAGALAGALDSPCSGTLDVSNFFHFFDFFRRKNQKNKKKLIFLIFFSKRPKNEKNQKKSKK